MTETQPQTRAPAGAVRAVMCPLCWAGDGKPCQRQPAGDHLARWLRAYRENAISRDQLKTAISNLIVVTAQQIIDERGVA